MSESFTSGSVGEAGGESPALPGGPNQKKRWTQMTCLELLRNEEFNVRTIWLKQYLKHLCSFLPR
jgi:hypothetical protein